MNPEEITVSFSLGTFVAAAIGGLLPGLIWAWKITKDIQELLEMHRDPNQSAANKAQQELVRELHNVTSELHQNNLIVIQANTNAIREMTHYIKWMAQETTGKNPPPPLNPNFLGDVGIVKP